MQNFQKIVNHKETSQTQVIPGRAAEMQRNNYGGVNFVVSDRQFLLRFLVTGAGAGTYNVGGDVDIATGINRLSEIITNNGMAVVKELIAFSAAGRAPKNDPALYVLAMCGSCTNLDVRRLALCPDTIAQVVRTGTHLFTFINYVGSMRGWGRALRRAIASWYDGKNIENLTYQVLKYRQREGYSHNRAVQLAHPSNSGVNHQKLYKYITRPGDLTVVEDISRDNALVSAFIEVQDVETPLRRMIELVSKEGLPWEFLPTHALSSRDVWAALLPKMNIGALVRNLGKLSSIGLLVQGSEAERIVVNKLRSKEAIQRSRIHPFNIMNALCTYQSNAGFRGSLTWRAVPRVVDALDEAFYSSFGNVRPTGKRIMLSVDVSGSMDFTYLSSNPAMSARVGAMAMSLVTMNIEDNVIINGFSGKLVDLAVSPRRRLDDNISAVNGLTFGRTDCSLPMATAIRDNLEIDTFVIYTDNETWSGNGHPSQVLKQYRNKTGIDAKLITVCMSGSSVCGSIADPRDPGMLDVVGFDTSTPSIISEFSKM